MVSLKKYKKDLEKLSLDYLVFNVKYVPDIMEWAAENNLSLGEPHLPMKLVVESENDMTMVIQSEIQEEMIADVIRNLGIRWSVKDNVTDMEKKLDTDRKRLGYCFLKEYARALQHVDGGELSEDEWVLEELEFLGYLGP
ncbi:MAG: hypothetical protein C4581_00365 [Nitrospiraceae bacterium]|nr:MAG: hypothetical protein C4581_00365 [Nitrospiraceae bacterium]